MSWKPKVETPLVKHFSRNSAPQKPRTLHNPRRFVFIIPNSSFFIWDKIRKILFNENIKFLFTGGRRVQVRDCFEGCTISNFSFHFPNTDINLIIICGNVIFLQWSSPSKSLSEGLFYVSFNFRNFNTFSEICCLCDLILIWFTRLSISESFKWKQIYGSLFMFSYTSITRNYWYFYIFQQRK